MNDEVKRILKLVQDGKLSAEDAAELIETFEAGEPAAAGPKEGHASPGNPPPGDMPPPPPRPTHDAFRDSFKTLMDSVERIGREASDTVNWREVARQARVSAQKGAEAIKTSVEEIAKGKFSMDFFGARDQKEITLPLNVPSGKLLKIDNPCGDVVVVGGFDVGSVIAKASFRGSTYEDANAKAAAYTLIVEESEAAVTIRQPDVTGLAVDIEVQLCGTGAVEIRSANGDIEVLNTKGACRVQSRNGDVTLKGLDGLIEISTVSGDIDVEDVTTPSLSAEVRSGNISIKRATGSVNAKTASGDIGLEECAGQVISLESVSGDVDVDLVEPISGSVNIRTVRGNAYLKVPDGNDCRVSIATMRGDVSCELDMVEESRSDKHAKGRLGAGTGTLDVSAVNGDVSVEQRAHATV